MDATVSDFLNEINQIAPKKDAKQKPDGVWQECYDEVTGYSYYWNTVSDEVTWTPPKSFKAAENNPKKTSQTKPTYPAPEKKKPELFVPPSAPQYSSASVNPEAKVKIYSIQDNVAKVTKPSFVHTGTSSNKHKPVKRRPPGTRDESDDEKIVLITEYGGDSDSDSEEIKKKKPPTLVRQNDSQSDEDDDIDILARIQQRAKELKKLGGEVPPEVKNIIQKTHIKEKQEKPKVISGFSLVAGYNSASDSEPEQEEKKQEPPPKQVFPVVPPPKPIPETSHSTLFPIPQAIDVKDFIAPTPQASETVVKSNENNSSSDFDNKAFQRKRRIGISLVNNAKKPKDEVEPELGEFKGFGFNTETNQTNDNNIENKSSSTVYPGFQKGGVIFVKTNVLNPSQTSEETKVVVKEENKIDRKETDDIYTVLRQKLVFLGEGRTPVLPVQAMLIQAETLFVAMEEGGLKLSYLHKWLKDTSSDLIKLEKEAAPEGWLLQWDRSHNRYFYQNQATGESQWEYPQPDISRFDEAMDISTTPPPPELPEPPPNSKPPVSPVFFGPQLPAEPPLPPSPPKISSPTPPPPPMISLEPKTIYADVPLPPEPQPTMSMPPLPPPPKKNFENGEPLPPGVDLPEVAPYNSPKEPEVLQDSLSSVLDSFYSEIAEATENTNSNSPPSSSQLLDVPLEAEDFQVQMNAGETVKKKKKKVKLAQGITMKKKGVSQLVEKWKNVQKNYGD